MSQERWVKPEELSGPQLRALIAAWPDMHNAFNARQTYERWYRKASWAHPNPEAENRLAEFHDAFALARLRGELK